MAEQGHLGGRRFMRELTAQSTAGPEGLILGPNCSPFVGPVKRGQCYVCRGRRVGREIDGVHVCRACYAGRGKSIAERMVEKYTGGPRGGVVRS